MTDTTQVPTSWLPSLASIRETKWGHLFKYGAVALGAVMLWGLYQNVPEWFKPAPPQVVYQSDVTKADLDALKTSLDLLASRADLQAVLGRVSKLEDKISSRKK